MTVNKNYNIRIKDLPQNEYYYGHKACAGCGGTIAVRLALKVFGERTYTVIPAGCMAAVSFIYPQMAFTTNAMIAPFPATAAMTAGVAAGAKALGQKNFHALGIAGDGGTADIGLQALSGAVDRWDDIIYICYDNEAYMNTGIQKSGLTPYGTWTTTTPAGENLPGSIRPKKNMFEIMAAHEIAYAATASIGYPNDFMRKLNKAKDIKGPRYIHVLTSCPTGWGSPTEISVELCKDAVDAGLWYLAEYENGDYKLNRNPKEFAPVENYFSKQGRFKHLNEDDISEIKKQRDQKWEKMRREWL